MSSKLTDPRFSLAPLLSTLEAQILQFTCNESEKSVKRQGEVIGQDGGVEEGP